MILPKQILRLRPDQNRDEVASEIERTHVKYADKLADYKYAQTAQQWWDILKDWWDEITAIWYKFIPDTPSPEILLAARKRRDPALVRFCHVAWMNAPDNGTIHAIPGWEVLCDLCSECHVLYDEDGPEGKLINVPPEAEAPLQSQSPVEYL